MVYSTRTCTRLPRLAVMVPMCTLNTTTHTHTHNPDKKYKNLMTCLHSNWSIRENAYAHMRRLCNPKCAAQISSDGAHVQRAGDAYNLKQTVVKSGRPEWLKQK